MNYDRAKPARQMWSAEQLDRAAEARRARELAKTERRVTVSCAPGLWSDCGELIERPLVRLTGEWLAAVGFPIGTKVHVQIEPQRLVLTPLVPGEP